jgi:MFS family permease
MPKDLATRISYFYCASALSGAFSGLLAAAIAQMDGVAGYEGWRWIFLLEGIATVVLGVACFFLLIDTPALSTRWLEPEEIQYLELSMFIKQGGKFREEDSGFKWRDLRIVLTNWRVYVQAYFLICQSALSYGKTLTLLIGLFTNSWTQLICVNRNQVHTSNDHQGHGIQLHQRPAHISTSLCRRRHFGHHLCTPV